jgi:hypothetical protein
VNAIQAGRFAVTDGPAIRIAIDRNGNGKIDDNDIQMGDILDAAKLGAPVPNELTLLTEVASTPEFGAIMDVDVYVGAGPASSDGPGAEARMYAPMNHGPGGFDGTETPYMAYESNGHVYRRHKDGYWDGEQVGDQVTWNQVPGAQLKYSVTLATKLHLDNYEVRKGTAASRFFVRAFARTADVNSMPQEGVSRYGFTNPIWIVRR